MCKPLTPTFLETTMKLGLFLDMPLDEYLAVDAVSSTGLKLMARSAWHYRNRVETVPNKPMLRGSLAHTAVLEADAMESRYVVVPSDAPRRPSKTQWAAKNPSEDSMKAMDWWTSFEDRNANRQVISSEDYELCQLQLEAVRRNPELANILREGKGEVSLFWKDPETGLYCKARPDWLPSGLYASTPLDLKTTADESPNGFGRAAARMRYDLQAAHYTDGIEVVLGVKVQAFVFGAVTNKPPVLAVPYCLTDEIRDQGRDERRELLERLAYCKRENEWPAYGAGIQMLDFPAYAKASGEVEVEWSETENS